MDAKKPPPSAEKNNSAAELASVEETAAKQEREQEGEQPLQVVSATRIDAWTRLYSVCAKVVWWSVIGALLLCALAVAWLRWYAAPRLDGWTPQIESYLSEQAHAPVRIGQLQLSSAWPPVLRVEDVRVLSGNPDSQQSLDGQMRLHIPLIELRVTPLSLLRGGFEQLYIEGLDIQIVRDASGRMTVGGIELDADDAQVEEDAAEREERAAAMRDALDWFFEQPEFYINKSRVQWVDRTRDVPVVHANDIQLVVRNGLVYKRVYLSATPDSEWGKRYVLKGEMEQSYIATGFENVYKRASGSLYLHFPELDARLLNAYVNLPNVQVQRSKVGLRAWARLSEGALERTTADVLLTDAEVQMAGSTQPLQLDKLTARARWLGNVPVFENTSAAEGEATRRADFARLNNWDVTQVNVVSNGKALLKGAEASARHRKAQQRYTLRMPQGSDIQSATRFGELLLPVLLEKKELAQAHDWIRKLNVKGHLTLKYAQFELDKDQLQSYRIEGDVQQLQWNGEELTPQDRERMAQRDIPEKLPGVKGLDGVFVVHEQGGEAQLHMQQGHVDLPGIFMEPRVPIDDLKAQVEWTIRDGVFAGFAVRDAQFANDDAAGVAHVAWTAADASESNEMSGEAGSHLDVHGTFHRAKPHRVYRYLPATVRQEVRDYLQASILDGHAPKGDFQINGKLSNFPWVNDPNGVFHIGADAENVQFRYAPPHLARAGDPPWPDLTVRKGRFDIKGESIFIKDVVGSYADAQLLRAQATIADYNHSIVEVDAQAAGDVAQVLNIVDTSPLRRITNAQLADVTGSGGVRLGLKLALPISEVNATRVQGEVDFDNSTVKLLSSLPALQQVHGQVQFTEQALHVPQLHAQWLGGVVNVHGGMLEDVHQGYSGQPVTGYQRPLRFDITGTASAAGLYELAEMRPSGAPQSALLSGQANYRAQLNINDAQTSFTDNWTVRSDLQGVQVHLPAPLGKSAEQVGQLFVRGGADKRSADEKSAVVTKRRRLQVRYAPDAALPATAAAAYTWQDAVASESGVRNVRGRVNVGAAVAQSEPKQQQNDAFTSFEHMALPDAGVEAFVEVPQLDVSQWYDAVAQNGISAGSVSANASGAGVLAALQSSWLPRSVRVNTGQLFVGGESLGAFALDANREVHALVADVRSDVLQGKVRYDALQGDTGGLRLRASQLHVPQAWLDGDENEKGAVGAVSALHEKLEPTAQWLHRLPQLDARVDTLRLGDTALGAVRLNTQLYVQNGVRVGWQVVDSKLETPHGNVKLEGEWLPSAQGVDAGTDGLTHVSDTRSQMSYTLTTDNAGELMAYWGVPDVLDKGKGTLAGKLAWQGAPWQMRYANLSGDIRVDVRSGRFLQADPGAAKLLWLFSLQALPKRLTLNFGDAVAKGVSFKTISSNITVQNGVARTDNFAMKGDDLEATIEGETNLAARSQNLRVHVVPNIDARGASLVAAAINPAVGVGTFIAQSVLGKSLSKAAAQEFDITGTWDNPVVEKADKNTAQQDLNEQKVPIVTPPNNDATDATDTTDVKQRNTSQTERLDGVYQ